MIDAIVDFFFVLSSAHITAIKLKRYVYFQMQT